MPRHTIIFAILLILLSGAAVAIAAISENTGVSYGGTSSLTGLDGVCKKVTNASPTGKQVYVPGSTAAEWQSFVSAAGSGQISGVSLASCGCSLPWGGTLNDGQSVTAYQAASAPYGGCVSQTRTCSGGVLSGSYQYQSCSASCGGAVVGGYCWYLGASAQSCDTACSTHGGTNISGTNGYAGAGGTNAQCQLVMNTLDQPYTYVVSDNSQPGATAAGCGKVYLTGGERRRYLVNPTTGSATYPAFRRACACNN